MTAAVGSVIIVLVGERMTKCRKRIQFSDQSDMRMTASDRCLEGRPEAEIFNLYTVFSEVIGQDLFIGELLISQFRM